MPRITNAFAYLLFVSHGGRLEGSLSEVHNTAQSQLLTGCRWPQSDRQDAVPKSWKALAALLRAFCVADAPKFLSAGRVQGHDMRTRGGQFLGKTGMRSSRCRCCIDPQVQLFESLLSVDGVKSAVKLASRPEGRCLVTTRAVDVGETLLTVPRALLITAHRSGIIGGLQGQTEIMWEAAGDLRDDVGEAMFAKGATWDVRLALAVFDACSGAGGPFWDAYRQLLPPPPKVAHPLTLPENWLYEMQDEEMEAEAALLRHKLAMLYPLLDEHAVHPATAGYEEMGAPMEQIPKPLVYMYALVASRCFRMSDGDTFAFVPFLDMCNHAAKPTANFGSGQGGFALEALKPLNQGDEVSICYGEDYTTSRLFSQYGFVPAQGTEQDSRMLHLVVDAAAKAKDPETVAALGTELLSGSIAGMQALGEALKEHSNSTLSTDERRAAIFDAIAGVDDTAADSDDDRASKGVPPAALLAAVRWQIASFPSLLQEDEEKLKYLVSEAGGNMKVDPRVMAVMDFRIARKRLLSLTEKVLSTLLEH